MTGREIAELSARYPSLRFSSVIPRCFAVVDGKCTDDELIEGLSWIRDKKLLADVDRVDLGWPPSGRLRMLTNHALYEIWSTILNRKSPNPFALYLTGGIFSWNDVDVKVLLQGIRTDFSVKSLVFREFNHDEFAKAALLISLFAKSLKNLSLGSWDDSFNAVTMKSLFHEITCLQHLEDIFLPAQMLVGQLSILFVNAVKRSGMRLKAFATRDVEDRCDSVQHKSLGVSEKLDFDSLNLFMKDQINIENLQLRSRLLHMNDAYLVASVMPHALQELEIDNGCSAISQKGLHAVLDILRTCPSMRKLIWRCSCFNAAMLEQIARVLLETNHMLDTLDIPICRINDPLPVFCSALRKTNLRRIYLCRDWTLLCQETTREIVRGLKYSLIDKFATLSYYLECDVVSHLKFVKSKDFKAVFAMCSAKLLRLGQNSYLRMLSRDLIKQIAIAIFRTNAYLGNS